MPTATKILITLATLGSRALLRGTRNRDVQRSYSTAQSPLLSKYQSSTSRTSLSVDRRNRARGVSVEAFHSTLTLRRFSCNKVKSMPKADQCKPSWSTDMISPHFCLNSAAPIAETWFMKDSTCSEKVWFARLRKDSWMMSSSKGCGTLHEPSGGVQSARCGR